MIKNYVNHYFFRRRIMTHVQTFSPKNMFLWFTGFSHEPLNHGPHCTIARKAKFLAKQLFDLFLSFIIVFRI